MAAPPLLPSRETLLSIAADSASLSKTLGAVVIGTFLGCVYVPISESLTSLMPSVQAVWTYDASDLSVLSTVSL